MEKEKKLKVILAQPRGFCAGVERAIEIVERALEKFGSPVYVRHEIVHNKSVVEALIKKGAVFVNELQEVPEEVPVIFSAHGVPKEVIEEAKKRKIFFIDAVCPLITKIHHEAALHYKQGREIILIGHLNHPEIIGTMGQLPDGAIRLVQGVEDAESVQINNPNHLAYITQTTLSVDETREIVSILKERFPKITEPKKEDICYATTNRQAAVRAIAPQVDAFIIVGSKNSSNSNRLVEVAQAHGCDQSVLVECADEINWDSFMHIKSIGLTAGASAPEHRVQEIVREIEKRFNADICTFKAVDENMAFKMPRVLK